MADGAPERLDAARQQGRRRDEQRLGSDQHQRLDQRPGDPRVKDVADDPDRDALEPAERPADREQVEQRLRRVLVLPVARVDDVRLRRGGDEVRGAE